MLRSVPLRVMSSPDGLLHAPCVRCRSPLSLHIPDPHRPERFLGVCEECRAWVIIDDESGLAALLPDLLKRDSD